MISFLPRPQPKYHQFMAANVLMQQGGQSGPWAPRFYILMLTLMLMFVIIIFNLTKMAQKFETDFSLHKATTVSAVKRRPDLVDRHGLLLATDIEAPSLYINPKGIMDLGGVVQTLKRHLPDIDEVDLLRQMTIEKRQFVFIKRGVSPRLAQKIFDLGLPGVNILHERRRVYPKGSLGGHILGHVNIDNIGRSGMELYLDKNQDQLAATFVDHWQGKGVEQLRLSIDSAATHILREHLSKALVTYKAKAASGLVMNVETGEVVSAVSLPDFDPQKPGQLFDKTRFDRLTHGVFELGSVFKVLTMGLVLDRGLANLNTRIDVSGPMRFGSHTIKDHHPVKGPLRLADVFLHSSNLGTARLAALAGTKAQKEFLRKLNLLTPLSTEIGTGASPQQPERWGRVHGATISYGHGIAVSPLQFTSAVAALVNGGDYIPPTFLKRSKAEAGGLARRVISSETSEQIRRLLRANVTADHGTAKRADVKAYRVGGKTGTANKIGDVGYDEERVLATFVATFPTDAPRYVIFVMLDEPKAVAKSKGLRVAGMNTVPVTGAIIRQLAPLFKIQPKNKK